MKTYLVGGAVRDGFLGLEVFERDWLVTGATPKQMQDKGFVPVGKDFPVFLHPKTHEEYALARTERKQGTGHQGFVFNASPNISVEDDLLRRDLTINAIAQSKDGETIDPYNGHDDIENRILRHVSPAFAEDPLRVLRVARFAARFHHLGFRIASETLTLMQTLSQSGELQNLSAERVFKELEKALNTQNPEVFIEVLKECGALQVLMPEVQALFGVPQTEKHHPEIDTGIHTLMVLQQACLLSTDASVRFAALTHDLGKGITPKDQWPKHVQHESRGLALVKTLCKRLRIPKAWQQLALVVCEQHLNCHRALELKPATVAKLLKKIDAYRNPERLSQFLLACKADARGRLGFETVAYPQADYLQQCFEACQNIGQKDVPQHLTGPDIGLAIEDARIKAIKLIKQAFQQELSHD